MEIRTAAEKSRGHQGQVRDRPGVFDFLQCFLGGELPVDLQGSPGDHLSGGRTALADPLW